MQKISPNCVPWPTRSHESASRSTFFLRNCAPSLPTEFDLARSFNTEHQLCLILLTKRAQEPHHLYERSEKLFKIEKYGRTPEGLACAKY